MGKRHSRRGRARLVGLGSDAEDGHLRVTNGAHMALYNGSKETHNRMQEKAIEFMRRVRERGLSMDSISRGECREILAELGLQEEEHVSS
jgi:hypothetical protein